MSDKRSFLFFGLRALAANILAVSLLITGCSDSTSGDKKLSRLETEIIRVDLSGHLFDVPLRYMYGEAIEKWSSKHWPKAKEGRVKVDYIDVSMLLPDLKPYFPEDDARWKVLGHGEKIEVSLGKERGDNNWFSPFARRTEESAAAGTRYHKEADRYGLSNYADNIGNTYFALDGRHLVIDCSKAKGVSPSCSIKSDYRDGIVLEYYYGQNYLPQWKQIDDGLKSLFDQFATTAQSNSGK